MLRGGLGVEQALIHHQLHPRVVAGLGVDAAVAQQVEARVAGMGPVRKAVLHHAGDDGGARRFGQLLVEGVVEDRMVGARQRARQEQPGVGQAGLGLALEGLGDELGGEMGRDLAVQVAPHAVGDQHEQRVARIAVGDAVLVGLAPADPAFLEDGESQGGLRQCLCLPMKDLRRAPRSVNQVAGMGSPASLSISAFCSV